MFYRSRLENLFVTDYSLSLSKDEQDMYWNGVHDSTFSK